MNTQSEKIVPEQQKSSPMFELLFDKVPNPKHLLFTLEAIEPRLGRELKNKDIMVSLIVSFFEGRKRILEKEYGRYGERLKTFEVPSIFLRLKGAPAAYYPENNLVSVNLLALEQIAALPQGVQREWIHPKTGETGLVSTPTEFYDAAGVEEFDHAVYFFLHPEESRGHSNGEETLSDYDSQKPEYHARGMQVDLGTKSGYSKEALKALRSRLKNALPKLLTKRSR